MQLNDAIEGQQSGTSIPLRVYAGARWRWTTRDFFQGAFVHPVCIFSWRKTKGIRAFHAGYMSKVLNSTAFWYILIGFLILQNKETIKKSFDMLAKLFSATILNQNESIETAILVRWNGKLFFRANMFVWKNTWKNNSIAPFVGGPALSFSK